MFDLPHSEQIDEELDVSPGTIQPFENGYITTWVGRRKTPYGHRLIRQGELLDGFAREIVPQNSLEEAMHGRP